jgi:prophage regulatory protein
MTAQALLTPASLQQQQSLTLTKQEVCFLGKMKPRTLETKVREGTFPPPVRLGKCVYWSRRAFDTWYNRTFGAQENWPRASVEEPAATARQRRRA